MILRNDFELSKPVDAFAEYRNPDGSFKVWLHTFAYSYGATHLEQRLGTRITLPWAALPWMWDERPSASFINAMYHVGLLKKVPGDWGRYRPPVSDVFKCYVFGSIYAVLLPAATDLSLLSHLHSVEQGCLNKSEFMQRLESHYVLFKQER